MYDATKVFPDTEQGALDCLQAETEGSINLAGATVKADPWVYGVWLVETPNDSEVENVIVYLAGCEMPNGRVRERNDFECFYPPEDAE